ncbi:MAG: type II toxin-antitoxin system HicB family antitoxin [Synergistaceae bacterium]|nr:type II toxin-antitoxin system HicB family antitoxin [Synergistaceae bacterium]
MKKKYVFPAVFDYSETPGISISFPDFPGCLSEADDNEQAISMARDALSGRLYILDRDGEDIPEPSDPVKLLSTLEPMQTITLIDVNMQVFSEMVKSRSVNKMCTIPEWLLDEGKEAGINFSQTLQDAVMQKLGIQRQLKRRQYKSKQYA